MNILHIRTVESLRNTVHSWKNNGMKVALVPTMGALHAGHASLMRLAREHADRTVASVFVNPAQFGAGEDFMRYPRQEAADLALLEKEGVDAAYLPSVEEMYPAGHATTVSVRHLPECLCGLTRPGHFEGVATVVAKLLLQSGADIAVFGEKDYQQLLVIRRMAEDLCIPARILGAPTLREADGLAMSSRNAYLSAQERAAAPELYRALKAAAERLRNGAAVEESLEEARKHLLAAGFSSIDYLELRASETLSALPAWKPGARLFAAAFLGKTRLIDNITAG